jgi:hypothetical protein
MEEMVEPASCQGGGRPADRPTGCCLLWPLRFGRCRPLTCERMRVTCLISRPVCIVVVVVTACAAGRAMSPPSLHARSDGRRLLRTEIRP